MLRKKYGNISGLERDNEKEPGNCHVVMGGIYWGFNRE